MNTNEHTKEDFDVHLTIRSYACTTVEHFGIAWTNDWIRIFRDVPDLGWKLERSHFGNTIAFKFDSICSLSISRIVASRPLAMEYEYKTIQFYVLLFYFSERISPGIANCALTPNEVKSISSRGMLRWWSIMVWCVMRRGVVVLQVQEATEDI